MASKFMRHSGGSRPLNRQEESCGLSCELALFAQRRHSGNEKRLASGQFAPFRRLSIVSSLILSRSGDLKPQALMLTLFHHPLCPHSRYVRLILRSEEHTSELQSLR